MDLRPTQGQENPPGGTDLFYVYVCDLCIWMCFMYMNVYMYMIMNMIMYMLYVLRLYFLNM